MSEASEPLRSLPGRDQIALGSLFDRFRGPLTRYFAGRTKDRSEIDDLVQEVFLRLAKRGDVADIEATGGYVFETAASVVNDRLRRRRVRNAEQHATFDPERHDRVEFGPDRVLLAQERLRLATSALRELPERTQYIFVLRRLEGMRYKQISNRLGISVSAVEKHMERAIAHLGVRLGKNDLDASSPCTLPHTI